MEPMTPEERFIRIENAIEALTETAVRHDAAIRDLIVVSGRVLESQKLAGAQIEELKEDWRFWAEQQEKRFAAQQERFAVQQERLADQQERLAEQQRITEEKLNALIQVVDRIIRDRNL